MAAPLYHWTMRRSNWARLVSMLFTVWFAFVSSEPQALHLCPLHDSHGASHAAHASHAQSAGNHHTHGSHGAHTCSCMGSCCAGTSAVAAKGTPRLDEPSVVAFRSVPVATDEQGKSAVDHLRPPSIGPPGSPFA